MTEPKPGKRDHEQPRPARERDLREIMTEQEIREKEQRDRLLDREAPDPAEERRRERK